MLATLLVAMSSGYGKEPGHHTHQWDQFDRYYTTTRGMEHVILKDRCLTPGCRYVKTVIGGPLMVIPFREIKEDLTVPLRPYPPSTPVPVPALPVQRDIEPEPCHCMNCLNRRAW